MNLLYTNGSWLCFTGLAGFVGWNNATVQLAEVLPGKAGQINPETMRVLPPKKSGFRKAQTKKKQTVSELDCGIFLSTRLSRLVFRIMRFLLRQTDPLFQNLSALVQEQREWLADIRQKNKNLSRLYRVGQTRNHIIYARLQEKEIQLKEKASEIQRLQNEIGVIKQQLYEKNKQCSELRRDYNQSVRQVKTLSAEYHKCKERYWHRDVQLEKMLSIIGGMKKLIVPASTPCSSGRIGWQQLKKENELLHQKLQQVEQTLALTG
jgi:chromosome segregation ATPase